MEPKQVNYIKKITNTHIYIVVYIDGHYLPFENDFKQFIWRPYDMEEINGELPLEIYMDRLLWTTFTSLICFEVVEWHQTDRVIRQFGFA